MPEPTIATTADGWLIAKYLWGGIVTIASGFAAVCVWIGNRAVERVDALEAEQIPRDEFERRFAGIERRLEDMEARQTNARSELRVQVETNRAEARQDFQRMFDRMDEVRDAIRSSTGNWPQQQR